MKYHEIVTELLTKQGIDAGIAHTGGGCMALYVEAGDSHEILITDGDAGLPEWDDETGGVWVRLYSTQHGDTERRYWVTDPSASRVAEVVAQVLARKEPTGDDVREDAY